MLTKLQANVGEANKLIDAFEKGEDVTRKLSNKLTSLQKESNKLSVQQLRLDHLLEKAKLRLPQVEFHHCLIEDFETAEKFDNVFLLMILEHVQDPVQILKRLCRTFVWWGVENSY